MTSSVLVHVPHGSRTIPADVRSGIVLSDADLERELDLMTDSLTEELARAVSANVLAAPVSRLVVDVERFPDDRESMNAVGMGAVYTRTHDGRVLRDTADPTLLDRWFHPHAAAVTAQVDAMLAEHGRAVLLDLHSYPTTRLPYELAAAAAARPQVCLGTDPFHTPPWLVAAGREAFEGWDVALDSPFAGTYVPLTHYGTDARVASLMVELRRDAYLDEATVRATAGFDEVVTRLALLVDALARGT
ncbi:N-formylglutamate amidohydrolase [Cellulomonas sp. P5_E12]